MGVFPYLVINILNGGVHAANTVDFQEFMITEQEVSEKGSKSVLKSIIR